MNQENTTCEKEIYYYHDFMKNLTVEEVPLREEAFHVLIDQS